MLQTENHVFTGMQQDISVSKQHSEYLINAHNIRITARDGETFLSITNERGPELLSLKGTIIGTIIGHCVLNKYLVLFTHQDAESSTVEAIDSIYRIDMSQETPEVVILFQNSKQQSSLGFDVDYPIEAFGDYENELVQKVYWTDAKNQPRVINIILKEGITKYSWAGTFDFVPALQLSEIVSVTKNYTGSGNFASGVIQYAFTYFNKYGQETSIFYTTKLLSVSHRDRGGSPEETLSNTFTIEIQGIDTHFEYLRIYSIQRTSLNATPICKRLIDIDLSTIENNQVIYTDTGTTGSNVDPTALLYLGGESIIAQTISQKDGTLFLGNIHITRPSILNIREWINANIDTAISVTSEGCETEGTLINSGDIPYINTIDCSGFKIGETYRIGIQFQYKTGKWSNPVYLKDITISRDSLPKILDNELGKLSLPQIKVLINDSAFRNILSNEDYKRARLLMAEPSWNDRSILCQGIANPTLYRESSRYLINTEDNTIDKSSLGPLYAQSSWLFRPISSYGVKNYSTLRTGGGGVIPYKEGIIDLHKMEPLQNLGTYYSPGLHSTEIGICLDYNYLIDPDFFTIHTPELIFDDNLYSIDWASLKITKVGYITFNNTYGDIDIQTSAPTLSSTNGFLHKLIKTDGDSALISGLYYEDYIVDDESKTPTYGKYDSMKYPVLWPIFMWHKNGSLNNDISRSGQSSTLLKKKISNYHIAKDTTFYEKTTAISLAGTQLFSSNELSLIKVNGHPYMGNIDTAISSKTPNYKYFAGNPKNKDTQAIPTFNDSCRYRLGLGDTTDTSTNGIYYYSDNYVWEKQDDNIGDFMTDLCRTSEPVRIKYKSTPHLVCQSSESSGLFNFTYNNQGAITNYGTLPLVELSRTIVNRYGGTTEDALRSNTWIPISDPFNLKDAKIELYSNRGDTYYQRFECLKTYAFTSEDTNQVVDIASFLVESHLNLDGRYDRNRGQINNLDMSPTNFNLYNPIYSQHDNFFSYKILDDDFYKNVSYPNQITWTTEKQAGADVDNWTAITLASIYNMNGSKGQIQALEVWNNVIYCFQDNGISNLLFNSRVQIPTSDGVPIEITNNYKVEGVKYISDGLGCINKFTICPTPAALYFIDSVGGNLYTISANGVSNLSQQRNMITWFSNQKTSMWKPNDYSLKLFYDNNNNDLYIVSDKEALCYNEAVGQFISFYSYDALPVMFNVVDKFYCVKNNLLYSMFEGEYNNFFNVYQGYDFSFVSNGITEKGNFMTLDKIYSTMNFRADTWSDKLNGSLIQSSPFNYMQMWNEYQDTGEVSLTNTLDKPSILKKKFRVWRIQVPRDAKNKRDRIRNTWCKVKLGATSEYARGVTQFHDIEMQYFI